MARELLSLVAALAVALPGAHRPASTVPMAPADRAEPRADTVVSIRPGDRVVLENLVGSVSVGSWGRSELEVRTDDRGSTVMVRRSGSAVRVLPDDSKGRRRSVDASIRLPASVDLRVSGRALDVVIEGMEGRIEVDNVRGNVRIDGAAGAVRVRTIEGDIDVSRARAGVTASSQSDDVRLREVSGDVDVHSGDGDLELMDIRSSSVRAETQDGDIDFSGVIEDGGEYGFFVHDGDATIAIPAETDARVEVSTFDGEFESEFPVVLERFTGGREFDFSIGEPRARIQIQVFDGEIRLRRRR